MTLTVLGERLANGCEVGFIYCWHPELNDRVHLRPRVNLPQGCAGLDRVVLQVDPNLLSARR